MYYCYYIKYLCIVVTIEMSKILASQYLSLWHVVIRIHPHIDDVSCIVNIGQDDYYYNFTLVNL